MAGKVKNMKLLAFKEYHRKLKICAPKTATNHILGRWQ